MTKADKFLLAWHGATNVSDLFDPWKGWNSFKVPYRLFLRHSFTIGIG